jgi:threonine dehydrogenase-like Zn-dependent dehydrogenase
MQQLTYVDAGRVEWREVEPPSIASAAEAIVEPLAVATCDLDQTIVEGRSPFQGPFALGHEMIARVVDVGDAATVARPGDRVAVPFQISCGECANCVRGHSSACERGGMYGIGEAGGNFGGVLSDLVRIPFADAMLIKLPLGIDPAAAASAPDNVSDAWRAIVPPLQRHPEGRVLILAGPGACSIALYAVQIAHAAGAGAIEVLTGNAEIASKAGELGAEVAFVEKWPERHGQFDVVVENANERRGLACALRSLRVGGHCTVTSMHFAADAMVPIFEMYLRDVTVSVGRTNSRQALEPVLDLIASGTIDPDAVTSERATWDEAPDALLEFTTKLVITRNEAAPLEAAAGRSTTKEKTGGSR